MILLFGKRNFLKMMTIVLVACVSLANIAFAIPPGGPEGPPELFYVPPVMRDITQNSARAVFDTDRPTYANIKFCTTTDPASCRQAVDGVFNENHSVILSGLSPSVNYFYQIHVWDTAEPVNESYFPSGADISGFWRFMTRGDVSPPVISNVRASPSRTSAVLEWETNEDTTTGALYFEEGGEPVEAGIPDGGFLRFHSLTISGLLPGTRYYYNPHAVDRAGNSAWFRADPGSWPTFITQTEPVVPPVGDGSAPRIESIKALDITENSAKINWRTGNADGSPDLSDSTVQYCRSENPASCATVTRAENVEFHTLSLTGLLQNTRYYYEIRSKDPAGNIGMYPSSGTPILNRPNFITMTAGAGAGGGGGGGPALDGDRISPVLKNVSVSVASNIVITWDTDELSTSVVDFGPTSSYVFSAGSGTLVLSHRIVLNTSGLTPGGLYHFRARSADASGNTANSEDRTFRTPTVATGPAVSGSTEPGIIPDNTESPTERSADRTSSVSAQESEEDIPAEIQPFSEDAFLPEDSPVNKLIVLSILFVILGLSLMYALARKNHSRNKEP